MKNIIQAVKLRLRSVTAATKAPFAPPTSLIFILFVSDAVLQPAGIQMDKQNAAPTNSKPALDLEEVARLQLGETPETKADSLLWLRQALAGTSLFSIFTINNERMRCV